MRCCDWLIRRSSRQTKFSSQRKPSLFEVSIMAAADIFSSSDGSDFDISEPDDSDSDSDHSVSNGRVDDSMLVKSMFDSETDDGDFAGFVDKWIESGTLGRPINAGGGDGDGRRGRRRGRGRGRGSGRGRPVPVGRARGRGRGRQLPLGGPGGDGSDSDGSDSDGSDSDSGGTDFQPCGTTPQFCMPPGAQVIHPPEAGALQYFDLFYTEEVWQKIVTETNIYAAQQRAAHPPPPFAPRWQPVTIETMKAFIGLTLVMGITPMPHRHNYWRKAKWRFETPVGKVMSRDRFDLIWRYFHLQDSTIAPAEPDALWKLRWYIDTLIVNFKYTYTPDENVTVDESMIKFKGRLRFRQYLPSKPIKWGIKAWALCESSTGYLWNFQIYTGRAERQQQHEHGLSYRVVMDLSTDLHGSYMRVYTDNFYSSVELFQAMRARGLLACGTVRANRRGLPVNLLPRNVRLQRGEFRVAQKNELMCAVWMDTKAVMVLSNWHDPSTHGSVKRRGGGVERVPVEVPMALEDYQDHMGGVDLCDQMVGYYLLKHRSNKWWRRLYFHLQMVAVHNAYVVARQSNPGPSAMRWRSYQDFVEELAESLVGDVRSARAAPLVLAPQRATALHTIVKLYERSKTCRECSVRGGKRQRRDEVRVSSM